MSVEDVVFGSPGPDEFLVPVVLVIASREFYRPNNSHLTLPLLWLVLQRSKLRRFSSILSWSQRGLDSGYTVFAF